MKKVLALLISILMVFSVLPPFVLAEDTTASSKVTTIIAGSDFQAIVYKSDGTTVDYPASDALGAQAFLRSVNLTFSRVRLLR